MLLAVLLMVLSIVGNGASVAVLSRANPGRRLPSFGRPERYPRQATAWSFGSVVAAVGAVFALKALGIGDLLALLLVVIGPLLAAVAVQVRHNAAVARGSVSGPSWTSTGSGAARSCCSRPRWRWGSSWVPARWRGPVGPCC